MHLKRHAGKRPTQRGPRVTTSCDLVQEGGSSRVVALIPRGLPKSVPDVIVEDIVAFPSIVVRLSKKRVDLSDKILVIANVVAELGQVEILWSRCRFGIA